MADYRYVHKKEVGMRKQKVIKLIQMLKNELRGTLKFNFYFVGSASRNMVTRDYNSNKGYDFDINIEIDETCWDMPPKKVKEIFRRGLDKFVKCFQYDNSEDSKRVATIKVKDFKHSKILHSVDFCIVRKDIDGYREYIYYDKKNNRYLWEPQSEEDDLEDKAEWLKSSDVNEWQYVRYKYKEYKNKFPNDKSRSVYARTINDVSNECGYWEEN
ncbi:MAG: hypothetical protein HFG34_04515 [Eubacterium sp.]|nr:hypothetical protein [Eubacterium sp.]